MKTVVVTILALALLLSGVLTPSLEAASFGGQGANEGCTSRASVAHECCCGHPPNERCPCEVAPDDPTPEPLEQVSVSSSPERPVTALAPARFSTPEVVLTSPKPLERFGRHGHLAHEGPRVHLLEGVFRE